MDSLQGNSAYIFSFQMFIIETSFWNFYAQFQPYFYFTQEVNELNYSFSKNLKLKIES